MYLIFKYFVILSSKFRQRFSLNIFERGDVKCAHFSDSRIFQNLRTNDYLFKDRCNGTASTSIVWFCSANCWGSQNGCFTRTEFLKTLPCTASFTRAVPRLPRPRCSNFLHLDCWLLSSGSHECQSVSFDLCKHCIPWIIFRIQRVYATTIVSSWKTYCFLPSTCPKFIQMRKIVLPKTFLY